MLFTEYTDNACDWQLFFLPQIWRLQWRPQLY